MTKVKIFSKRYAKDLESHINDFIEDPTNHVSKVVDIKFSDNGSRNTPTVSAMIIYEDR